MANREQTGRRVDGEGDGDEHNGNRMEGRCRVGPASQHRVYPYPPGAYPCKVCSLILTCPFFSWIAAYSLVARRVCEVQQMGRLHHQSQTDCRCRRYQFKQTEFEREY